MPIASEIMQVLLPILERAQEIDEIERRQGFSMDRDAGGGVHLTCGQIKQITATILNAKERK